MKEKNTFKKIYEVVKRIPQGKVATYGQIAMAVGNPHLSQIVGYALHVNPDPKNIKCYRVVNRFGKLADSFAFGGADFQAEMLRNEGVEVINNTVDLSVYKVEDYQLAARKEE